MTTNRRLGKDAPRRQEWPKLWEAHFKERRREKARQLDIRAAALIHWLETARDATGDPIFAETLTAIRAYGLDHEPVRGLEPLWDAIFGDPDEGYFEHMDELLRRGLERSVSRAAERVVFEFKVNGESWGAAFERLRKRYPEWKKSSSNRPRIEGDLGYWIEVTPLAQIVPDVDGSHLAGPVCARATRWWRRRWRDGDVAISRINRAR